MFFKKATSGRNGIIWYILGVLSVMFGYMLGSVPLTAVQFYKVSADPSIGTDDVTRFNETLDWSILNMDKNLGFILMITIFIIAMLVFMLAIKYFHQRPFKNVITPNPSINYRKIAFGFGFWMALAFIFEGIVAITHPEAYYLNFKPISWIILLLICLFLLPIQSTFEELVLRGYLMPAFALITKNKWLPLLLSSVLFGLIHGANPEVSKFGFWTMQLYYVLAGLFLGLITVLDDSLELAIGVHAATNIFGAAFFSFDGSVLQTDSIVKASSINPYLMTATFVVSAIIFYFVCNKRYGWNGLSRLWQSPELGDESEDKLMDVLTDNY